jgi:hypothetical protein
LDAGRRRLGSKTSTLGNPRLLFGRTRLLFCLDTLLVRNPRMLLSRTPKTDVLL